MNKNSSDKDVLDAYERSVKPQAQSNGGTAAGLGLAAIALILFLVVGGFLFRSRQVKSSVPKPQPTPLNGEGKEIAAAQPAGGNSVAGVAPDEDHHEHHQHFEAEGALVTDHGIPLFQETQTAGGISPAQRAQIVAQRLNDRAIGNGLEPTRIQALLIHNVASVCVVEPSGKAYNLATVDPQTAAQFGYRSNPARLTLWWRDVLRDHILYYRGKTAYLYHTLFQCAPERVFAMSKARKGYSHS